MNLNLNQQLFLRACFVSFPAFFLSYVVMGVIVDLFFGIENTLIYEKPFLFVLVLVFVFYIPAVVFFYKNFMKAEKEIQEKNFRNI